MVLALRFFVPMAAIATLLWLLAPILVKAGLLDSRKQIWDLIKKFCLLYSVIFLVVYLICGTKKSRRHY